METELNKRKRRVVKTLGIKYLMATSPDIRKQYILEAFEAGGEQGIHLLASMIEIDPVKLYGYTYERLLVQRYRKAEHEEKEKIILTLYKAGGRKEIQKFAKRIKVDIEDLMRFCPKLLSDYNRERRGKESKKNRIIKNVEIREVYIRCCSCKCEVDGKKKSSTGKRKSLSLKQGQAFAK